MQKVEQINHRLTLPTTNNDYTLTAARLTTTTPSTSPVFTFSIDSTIPPLTHSARIIQRDEVIAALRQVISNPHLSALQIVGEACAGKSTLAALLYRNLEQAGAFRYFIWLRLGAYTALPDLIAAILSRIGIDEPGLFHLEAGEQIRLLARALQREQAPVFIVLDQFERLFDAETRQVLEGRGDIPLFFELLQTSLGQSRLVLTSTFAPSNTQELADTWIHSYQAPPIGLVEAAAFLRNCGAQGSPEEVSLAWQQCGGRIFALALCCDLLRLSGSTLDALLLSLDHQQVWNGDVTLNLLVAVYHQLNPLQRYLLRSLSLFYEPAPAEAIFMVCASEDAVVDRKEAIANLDLLTRLFLLQPILNKRNVPCYDLHAFLRQYTVEHFTEYSERQFKRTLFRTPDGARAGEQQGSKPGIHAPESRRAARAAGHMRVVDYYQQQVQTQQASGQPLQRLEDLEPQLAVVRHMGLGSQWERAFELFIEEELYERMAQYGAWHTLVGFYTSVLPPQGLLTRYNSALVCNYLGFLYERMGNYPQSVSYYDEALAIQRSLTDTHGEAVTLTNQGELLRSRGENERALANFERAYMLNQQQPDPLIESVILHNLGILHHLEKHYELALNYYQDALERMRDLEEQYEEGTLLVDIGMLLYELGRQPEAVSVLRYAIQLRKSLNDPTVSSLETLLAEVERPKQADHASPHNGKAAQPLPAAAREAPTATLPSAASAETSLAMAQTLAFVQQPTVSLEGEPTVYRMAAPDTLALAQQPTTLLPELPGQPMMEAETTNKLVNSVADSDTPVETEPWSLDSPLSEEERLARLYHSEQETQRLVAMPSTPPSSTPVPLLAQAMPMSEEERLARLHQSLLETQRLSAVQPAGQQPAPMSEEERLARLHQSLLETQRITSTPYYGPQPYNAAPYGYAPYPAYPPQPSPLPDQERLVRMHQTLQETQRQTAIRPVEMRETERITGSGKRARKKRWEETSGSLPAVDPWGRKRLGQGGLWSDGSF